MTLTRRPADVDRVVRLVTVLHGKLYKPSGRR
jgi:hypothetical protein